MADAGGAVLVLLGHLGPEWPKRWEKSICTKVVMALSSQVHHRARRGSGNARVRPLGAVGGGRAAFPRCLGDAPHCLCFTTFSRARTLIAPPRRNTSRASSLVGTLRSQPHSEELYQDDLGDIGGLWADIV